ncbi:iron chelate uptake ABC transporter family permease subunit [Kineosporia sp. J2-2]|uniref:Iron chelate uptake ABC transporter family permease subunit n=1 Tax=Kineosporia corallincola TaxID=2835133 RepID=A0ABS5TI47_9ACTN|nr:iron chelate uptake ABC transporter family permease subunit [Kineosporia corallincola]MBT0770757.1 iron chelate uptake ABC transporter family permease subunit [Kineosporia corallincola]
MLFDETDGSDFEDVADTQPDVILAPYSGLTQEDYDTLGEIAPTVAYPNGPWETNWCDMIKLSSQALGESAAGDELIAAIEGEMKAAAAEYPQFQGKKTMFLTHVDTTDLSKVSFYTDKDTRAQFFTDLGLGTPDSIAEASEEFSQEVSAETVDTFDDVEIIVTYGDDKLLKSLEDDPILSKMPAVASGAIVALDGTSEVGTAANPTPLAISYVLDDYVKLLADAVIPSGAAVVRRPRRVRLGWFLICLALLAVLVVASITIGTRFVSVPTILDALRGADDTLDEAVIRVRIPRTVLAILAGAALAVSGEVFQGVTRNPLADPGGAGLVICLLPARGLNSLTLGDDVAVGLGERVALVRGLASLGAVMLCGAATAICGPIGFVGLVVPHLCRLLVGPDHRWLLPFAALTGASLLVAADVAGRIVARPGEIDVGIVTAFVGAPLHLRRPSSKGPCPVSSRSGTARTTTIAAVRRGRLRRNRRRRVVVAVLVLLILVLAAVSLMVGRTFYPPGDVLKRPQSGSGTGGAGATFTVGRLRLPRTCLAVLAGACFGLGGVAFQTMLRNPLASPDIIGISTGASTAAAFAIISLGLSGSAVSVFAIVAGLGVTLLVYLLAYREGVSGIRLILIGIGIGIAAMMNSATSYILSTAGQWDLQEALRWLTGSLNGSRWEDVLTVLITMIVLVPVLLSAAKDLSMLQLGDGTASALGVRWTGLGCWW